MEPYQSPDITTNLATLVVDGFISDSATPGFAIVDVRLSRTTALTSTKPLPEQRATVTLEQLGSNRPLVIPETQTEAGYYSTNVPIDVTKGYKLHIVTKGKNYFSDVLQYKKTPPIDEIFYETTDEGVQIYLSTHNPVSVGGLYRWSFSETWHYRAAYDPRYYILNGRTFIRPPTETTWECWNTKASTKILVGSAENLSQDIINRFPITFIPKGSPKLSVKYSIQVQQQSVGTSEFSFWQQLQKTTESVGGLFDPLPSQVTGNVHNASDALEPVMGYVSWGSTTTKRIFIDLFDLPPGFNLSHISECPLIEIPPEAVPYTQGPLLIVSLAPIFTSDSRCLDCRLDGGVQQKPSFWP